MEWPEGWGCVSWPMILRLAIPSGVFAGSELSKAWKAVREFLGSYCRREEAPSLCLFPSSCLRQEFTAAAVDLELLVFRPPLGLRLHWDYNCGP